MISVGLHDYTCIFSRYLIILVYIHDNLFEVILCSSEENSISVPLSFHLVRKCGISHVLVFSTRLVFLRSPSFLSIPSWFFEN